MVWNVGGPDGGWGVSTKKQRSAIAKKPKEIARKQLQKHEKPPR
tara:strand:+ start:1612 stop:1743 length:132 start_codon:yes stop_codon:yes gene_type:complete